MSFELSEHMSDCSRGTHDLSRMDRCRTCRPSFVGVVSSHWDANSVSHENLLLEELLSRTGVEVATNHAASRYPLAERSTHEQSPLALRFQIVVHKRVQSGLG